MLTKIRHFLFHNTSSKQTVLKNTFWLFLAEAVSKGSMAVVIILIGRFFGKEVFGQYSYLSVILTFLLVFADLGITQLTIRDRQHLDEKDRPHRLRTGLSTKFLLSAGVILLYLGILWFTASSSFLWIVGLMLLFQGIANSFLEYLRATFRSMQRSETEMKIKFWQGVGNLALIPLLIITRSLPRVLLGQALVTVATCAYAWRITHQKTADSTTKNDFSRTGLMRNGWMFAMSGLFVSMYYYMDSLIIQWYRGYEAVGVYNAAYRIITLLIIPLGLLGGTLMPNLKNLYVENKKKFFSQVQRFTIMTGLIYISIISLFFIFSHQIITLLYGNGYIESVGVFKILLLTIIVISWYTNIAWSLYALGLQKRHMIASGVGVISNIILNIIFVPQYGIHAAAYTTLFTEIVAAFIMIIIFLRAARVNHTLLNL